jgi:hypothetical protein
MKVNNVHERVFAATADELAALVADFDRIWPTEIGPVPRPVGGLRGEHWFDLERVHEGVRLRHTIAGEAVGEYETIWRERIEPAHDQILDALLDKIELVVSGPSTKLIPSRRPGCTQARRP